MITIQELQERIAEISQRFSARGLDDLERRWLTVHEFTALCALRDAPTIADDTLRRALAEFSEQIGPIAGLHSARWLILDDELDREPGRREQQVSGPLVFAFLCDGNALDVLEELVHAHGGRFDTIFSHCREYPAHPTAAERLAFLRARRVRSDYMFRDSRQLEAQAVDILPSAREIQRALRVSKDFRDFMIEHPADQDPAALQRAFAEFRRTCGYAGVADSCDQRAGYGYELSPFERPLARERQWARRCADLARARARRDARTRAAAADKPAGLRGVHAKHHGLIEAELRVEPDLPPQLCHGLFQPGARYDALLRPSNGSNTLAPDWLLDARGLAIKVLDVQGPTAIDVALGDGLQPRAAGHTQDFLLVSHPTFFLKNARDYAIMRSLFDARPDGVRETLELLTSVAAFSARRPRELWTFARTFMCLPLQPLLVEFHSMLAFALGAQQAVKFSVRPSPDTRARLQRQLLASFVAGWRQSPRDFLRGALQHSLSALGSEPLELELAVHGAGEDPVPVEDPRLDWNGRESTRTVVAKIVIAKQVATSPERLEQAENLVLNVWHALAEHRPLGSLNRVRLETYLASAEERARVNRPQTQRARDNGAARAAQTHGVDTLHGQRA